VIASTASEAIVAAYAPVIYFRSARSACIPGVLTKMIAESTHDGWDDTSGPEKSSPSVVVLGGCTAANQQQAASTQEPQRLQTAQKPGGYDEQVFATCMASWGYKEGEGAPGRLR
jgi:hypothetical protein